MAQLDFCLTTLLTHTGVFLSIVRNGATAKLFKEIHINKYGIPQ